MIVAIADTHTLVWALFGDARLSPSARDTLTVSGDAKIGASAISLAEIVYLEEKQCVPAGTFERVATALTDPSGTLEEVPVDAAVVRSDGSHPARGRPRPAGPHHRGNGCPPRRPRCQP